MRRSIHNRAVEQGFYSRRRGFTLVEMLVVMLIVVITMLSVGQGFVKLLALEDLNREKARTLDALSQRFAWTQPYVAVGSSAISNAATEVEIGYPHIVFGIACVTNRFTQVTNCTISVRDDGALQTVIAAGRITGVRSVTNAMGWMDPIFSGTNQPVMAQSAVSVPTNNIVLLTYRYAISVKGRTDSEVLTVPVRLRNSGY